MPFRNPAYLDLELLLDVAEYCGVELQGDTQVTRRSLAERRRRFGINKVVDAGVSGQDADEVTEVYETGIRPRQALNNVLDFLLKEEVVVDLTVDPTLPSAQRDIVQVEGRARLSPATEIGVVMAAWLPSMFSDVDSFEALPREEREKVQNAVLRDELASNPGQPNFFHLERATGGTNVHLITYPEHLMGTTAMDDLDDDWTVLATVTRIIADGDTFPLDKYLMPGLNRTMRRHIQRDGGMDSIISGLAPVLDLPLSASDAYIPGPSMLLTPIAMY